MPKKGIEKRLNGFSSRISANTTAMRKLEAQVNRFICNEKEEAYQEGIKDGERNGALIAMTEKKAIYNSGFNDGRRIKT